MKIQVQTKSSSRTVEDLKFGDVFEVCAGKSIGIRGWDGWFRLSDSEWIKKQDYHNSIMCTPVRLLRLNEPLSAFYATEIS